MENTELIAVDASVPELLPLTLEAVYEDKVFEAKRLRQPVWLKDGKRFSYLENAPASEISVVWLYDVDTNQGTPVLDMAVLKLPEQTDATPVVPAEAKTPEYLTVQGYQWSPDETRLLFARIPRSRASEGDNALYVYDVVAKRLDRVAHSEHQYRNVKWSPDGRRLGYVREDDIYLFDLATEHETRLTDTASSTVYNGRFGWVYEEELGLVDGWAWSPDGDRIAYFQVDETLVPTMDLPDYADLHCKPVTMRYPKAGDPNPTVKIGIISLEENESPADNTAPGIPSTQWLDTGNDPTTYLARMQWTPNGELILQRIPRLQNRLDVLRVNAVTGEIRTILSETSATWVDMHGDVTVIEGTDQFLWLSERDGYTHLYLCDLNGERLRSLTQGAWEVEAIAHVDKEQRMVYFTAASPSPTERQLFRVSLDVGEASAEPERISHGAGLHSVVFAPDGRHYLDTFSSRQEPPHVRLHRSNGETVASVLVNPLPKRSSYALAKWEAISVPIADDIVLNGWMLRPRDFDPAGKYPVVMYTYGGPGSQVGLNGWGSGSGFEHHLAQSGTICVAVDGRGSGMRGRDFKKITYLNLGHYEVEDQVGAAKWLQTQPYVDPERIGIWGWSYGGYMASLCILRGAEVFKAAVAVAPVTHWQLYDSIYTERYMRCPQENGANYEQSSPLAHVEKLTGRFLLVHGLADDNVHFQNAARLAEAFQKQNKPFQMMAYPGKRHGLEGVGLHWSRLIYDFFRTNL